MKKDWIEVELDKVCQINMGQSPPSTTYNEEGNGLPFFQGKAEFTNLHPRVVKWCTDPKKIAKKGDILISVRAPVGSTNIADRKCAIGRGLAAITFPFGNGYLWYYLQLIEKKLDSLGTGTTFKAISGQILRSQKLLLPPLPEQRAIVARIEELFSELDHAIANLKSAQAKLEIYRQAVLKKAFEGGFTSAKENRFSDNWKSVRFEDITNNYDGKRRPLSRSYRENFKGEFPYYGACDVIDNVKEYIFDGEYLLIGEDGANLLTKSKPLAFIAKGKFWVNNHAHVIQPKQGINIHFLNLQFNSLHINEFVTGTAQPKLSQRNLNKIPIKICSVEEQNQIVQEIESRLSVADKLAETIQTNLLKSESLRQSILKQAFEGKLLTEAELEACRTEADWEPAERLLERINKNKMAK